MTWRWWRSPAPKEADLPPAAPPPPQVVYGPVLKMQCPRCQWPDTVVIRGLYRHEVQAITRDGETRAEVRTEEVGKVVRCARCVKEFCIGPSGVYVPEPPEPPPPSEKKLPERHMEGSRYKDQPWDKG